MPLHTHSHAARDRPRSHRTHFTSCWDERDGVRWNQGVSPRRTDGRLKDGLRVDLWDYGAEEQGRAWSNGGVCVQLLKVTRNSLTEVHATSAGCSNRGTATILLSRP